MFILQCRDFLKIKPIINQLAENMEFGHKFYVEERLWAEIGEIAAVLQPSYDSTIRMQQVGYGLSDFYIGWLWVKKNLERVINGEPQFDLAACLTKHMDQRAPSLFKSPLFLCSVYLDPRIMFTLTDEQKATAAMDLIKIQKRIMEANDTREEGRINDTLDEILQTFQAQLNSNSNSSDNLIQLLSIYEKEKPFDIKQPVMQFWEENQQKYQSLKSLADVLHAVPSNQCCTERSFSSLSYIRSKHRMAMSPKNLSNVLMVRLNKDIYYALREQRVRNILDN